jgi:hypothetical protein
MTRRSPITPEMLARINADARAAGRRELRDPYGVDLAYRIFTYGIGIVALVVIVLAVSA